jgi:hypothetical protein
MKRLFINPLCVRPHCIRHCDRSVALLDGPARVFVQSWMSVMPRAVRGAHVVREGAQSHGRTKEKNLPVARGDAPQSSGPPARGARRVPKLRRSKTAPSRVQPLRLLRRARSGGSREAAAGRCPGLRPGRRVLLVRQYPAIHLSSIRRPAMRHRPIQVRPRT